MGLILRLKSFYQGRGGIGSRLCSGGVAFLAAFGARYADGANDFIANHDGNAAAQRNGVGRFALAGLRLARLGPVAPVDRSHLELVRGKGLALRQTEIMRRGVVALEQQHRIAVTVYHRQRRV